jgi:hypothetical protein
MIYDIFYVSKNSIDEQDWKQFRSRFPSSQKIEKFKSFNVIKKKALLPLAFISYFSCPILTHLMLVNN